MNTFLKTIHYILVMSMMKILIFDFIVIVISWIV